MCSSPFHSFNHPSFCLMSQGRILQRKLQSFPQIIQISKYCNPIQKNLHAKPRTSSVIIVDSFLIWLEHKIRQMHQNSYWANNVTISNLEALIYKFTGMRRQIASAVHTVLQSALKSYNEHRKCVFPWAQRREDWFPMRASCGDPSVCELWAGTGSSVTGTCWWQCHWPPAFSEVLEL